MKDNQWTDLTAVWARTKRYTDLADRLIDGDLPGMDHSATATAIGLCASLVAGDMPGVLVRLDDAERELKRIRSAGVDPGMLRWCSWPSCLHSYPAHPGPGEPGWKRYNGTGLLLCPTHDTAGHQLELDTYPDPAGASHPASKATCQCGENASLGVVSRAEVTNWWSGHLIQLAGPRTN